MAQQIIVLTDEGYKSLNQELNKIKIYGERKNEDIAKLGNVQKELFDQTADVLIEN